MRKGFMDPWFWIGILIVLIVFAVLLYFQQTSQSAIEPGLHEGGTGFSSGESGAGQDVYSKDLRDIKPSVKLSNSAGVEK